MPLTDLLRALVLGLVEGVTEFLPVSSTGHLILAGHWLRFEGEAAKTFEVFIQLGAILAVLWEYRQKLFGVLFRAPTDAAARRFILNLLIAFLPAAIVGLLAHGWIKANLFSPLTVAWALIGGGVAMLVIERIRPEPRVQSPDDIRPATALSIGLVQVLSLFPGVSRSGATIMGGVAFGLSRPAATEFSFFLAVPVMLAATMFDLLGSLDLLTTADIPTFAVGFVSAFVSSLIVVRIFLRFVGRHSFDAFAWYRIAVGLIVLAVLEGVPFI